MRKKGIDRLKKFAYELEAALKQRGYSLEVTLIGKQEADNTNNIDIPKEWRRFAFFKTWKSS